MLTEINTIIYASDLQKGSRPAFRAAVKQASAHDAKIMTHIGELSGNDDMLRNSANRRTKSSKDTADILSISSQTKKLDAPMAPFEPNLSARSFQAPIRDRIDLIINIFEACHQGINI